MASIDTAEHRQADQLQRRAAGVVVTPRRAAWRRRHERHRAESDGGGPGAQGPSLLDRGFATYGSDSGHQAAFGARGGAGRGGAPGVNVSDDWALNEEAIRNLGYAQMKKTHDAAMVIIERAYGERPRFNYYIGTSQGGREALTVAQRYPADYDGIAANVPIVSFSTLMLAPELIRIPREAAGELGDAGQDQCDSRRVHAPVRRPRRSRRRHHQQLHGVPRDLRCDAGRQEPAPVGGEALSEQRRSES
jgi:hypothetical protein